MLNLNKDNVILSQNNNLPQIKGFHPRSVATVGAFLCVFYGNEQNPSEDGWLVYLNQEGREVLRTTNVPPQPPPAPANPSPAPSSFFGWLFGAGS